MNEQERAEWLARAVDNLIHHRQPIEPPPGLDEADLEEILNIARLRLECADTASRQGLQYEGAIWKSIVERLEARFAGPPTSSEPIANAAAGQQDPALDEELRGLEDIVRLRRRMAEEVMAFAESQRDAVWQAVRSRIQARSRKRSLLSLIPWSKRRPLPAAKGLDALAVGQTLWQSGGSRASDLVEMARKRRVLAQAAQDASSASERRVWSRIQSSLYSVTVPDPRQRPGGSTWRRLAAAGAIAALVIAALGPVPVTGFASHPAVRLAQYIDAHIGAQETSSPPPDSPVTEVVQGTTVSPQEAGRLLGLPVSQPTVLPEGFSLGSSIYYPTGIGSSSGAFVLTYQSAEATLVIIQEAAAGDDIAAADGFVQDLALADGTPASYVEGTWLPGDGGFTWSPGGAQTLVFERQGLRTVIQYTGPALPVSTLLEIAASMN